jgi:hypothetical protein
MRLRILVLILALSACGSQEASQGSNGLHATPTASVGPTASAFPREGPADAAAEIRPELIEASPTIVTPDETVELRFPQSTGRSMAFAMEEETGGTWNYVFQLVSDKRGGPPFWQEPDGPVEIDLIGISGLGPDRVTIPFTAHPGSYRLCTMFAPPNFCVAVEVVAAD